jgi:hypothetical protein
MIKAKFFNNTRLVKEMNIPEIKTEIYLPIVYNSQFMRNTEVTPRGRLEENERIFTPKTTITKFVFKKMNGHIAIYDFE